jgi:hypothetical protein
VLRRLEIFAVRRSAVISPQVFQGYADEGTAGFMVGDDCFRRILAANDDFIS